LIVGERKEFSAQFPIEQKRDDQGESDGESEKIFFCLPCLQAQMIDPDRNKKKVKRAVPVGQGGFIERRVEKKSQDHAAEQQGQADPVIVRLEVFEKTVEGDQEQKRAVKEELGAHGR